MLGRRSLSRFRMVLRVKNGKSTKHKRQLDQTATGEVMIQVAVPVTDFLTAFHTTVDRHGKHNMTC